MIAPVQTLCKYQLSHRKVKCRHFTFLQNTDMFKLVRLVRTMLNMCTIRVVRRCKCWRWC